MSPTAESRNGSRHGRIRIYRAIPEGSARAKSQASWIRALDAHLAELVDLGELRSDAAGNTRAIAWIAARHAHWKTFVTRPGWDTLTDRTGLSRSTIQRALRRLREWGFLGVVETGTTWRIRGGRHDDRDGNQGAEYVITVPAQEPVEISDPPSLGSRREPEKPHASARENHPQADTERLWPMTRPAATRQDRLQLTKRLQAEAPMLARITPQLLRHVLRPQLTAGWTVADLLHALDHNPDGQPHWHTSDVRHVAAWIRHRLKPWAGHQPPKPVGARQSTMLSAADVAALPRPTDPPEADVEAHASLARRLLTATQKRSDKKQPGRRGLGVSLPVGDGELEPVAEVRPPASRNPYDVDDPRHRHAAAADEDAAGWLLENARGLAERDTLPTLGALAGSRWARMTPDAVGRVVA